MQKNIMINAIIFSNIHQLVLSILALGYDTPCETKVSNNYLYVCLESPSYLGWGNQTYSEPYPGVSLRFTSCAEKLPTRECNLVGMKLMLFTLVNLITSPKELITLVRMVVVISDCSTFLGDVIFMKQDASQNS